MSNASMTVYSTQWCGYCRRLKFLLDEEGITYREIDIDADPSAASLVERVSGGYRAVPTVVMSDGTALVNPTMYEIMLHLDQERALHEESSPTRR